MSKNEEVQKILSSIFMIENKSSTILPLLISSKNISDLIIYLINIDNPLELKLEIITNLLTFFKNNENLITIFMRPIFYNSKLITLMCPLIDLYISSSLKDEQISIIEQFIKFILSHNSIDKSTVEYAYQKLSLYFTNKIKLEVLDEKLFSKYLNLLYLLYSENKVSNEINAGKEIKNYISFNGDNSFLYLKLNKKSNNLNNDFPTLENGISFIFWFYIKKELMMKYNELNEKNKFILIDIKIGEHKISLVLDDLNNINILLDKNNLSKINIKESLKYNEWNNMCFIMNIKNDDKLNINLIINNKSNNLSLPLTKDFQIKERINEIILFKNLIGFVTSVLFFSFELKEKQKEYFNSLKYGINKQSTLFEFFINNDKDFLSNAVNQNKYTKKLKIEKSNKLFDFSLKNQNIKNLMAFLLPFNYNKELNEIHDIFGNYYGILGENVGINNYKNNINNIKNLGGINNLLPLLELMYNSISTSKNIKYEYINKNILSENNFLLFFKILNNLLVQKEKNIAHTNFIKFFPCLEIFLEKFPDTMFNNDEIIKIFINIGKSAFDIDKKYMNNNNFISMILMNEKIICKFKKEYHILIWDNLYQIFLKNSDKLKEILNISKICIIIRYYNENRYNEYCCTKHSNLFKPNNLEENSGYKPNIMKPEIDIMLDKFFGIIYLYVEQISNEEEISDFYKLLLMDLYPCLQKKIILVFYNYFSNIKIPINNKKKMLDNLLKNNMIEISEYILIISLLDIRIELLKLFHIIHTNKDLLELCSKYLTNMKGENGKKINHNFFVDNSLPDKLKINNGKENVNIINYFNKEIYEKDLKTFWDYHSNWLTYKLDQKQNLIKSQKSENKSKNISSDIFISKSVLDFCLLFVSKTREKFIDEFISILFSFFQDETINNRIIIYENEYIYPWIIQTIFYYYSIENDETIQNKKIFENIRNRSINLFCEFFSHRRPTEEFIKRVNYILQYSYKLKDILKDNEKKIQENINITRILLEKLLQNAPKKINEVIKICFEFIIFYKNKEKYEEMQNNNKNDMKELSNKIMNFNLIKDSNNIYNYGLLPKFVFEGLNFNMGNKKGNNLTLKDIWKDSNLYNSIIDYYVANLWGVQYLCKKVKVEYNGEPLKISRLLLKEYADNKAYKNILAEDIIESFNLKISNQSSQFKIIEDNIINIFNLNLILLCIGLELSLDEEEQNFILGLFQQFLIYLILVSTNISSQEKYHDYIQEKIYETLGFGSLFLTRVSRKKYDEICDEILTPILEFVNSENSKKNIKSVFSGKKNMFNNTAIVKLFEGEESKNDEALKKSNKKKLNEINSENKLSIIFKGEISKIIKNVFNIDLFLKKEKDKADIKIFYNNIYPCQGIYDDENDKEKNYVLKKVLKLIPFYEAQIKNYSNDSALKEKIKRNEYKRIKKRLFSWRGFWSDRELFFNNSDKLKLKRKNHLSKEMTMPLLCTVLDIDYYFPDFSKFDKNKLFNKNNYDYKISLDIDDILRNEFDDNIEMDKDKNNKNKIINLNNSNYLENIYKTIHEKIWEKYLSYYESEINFNFIKIIHKNKKAFDMFLISKTIAKNEEERKIENIYNCCIVKQTHHIKGYISTEKNQLRFYFDIESRKYDTNELLENDPTYDRDMDCCFGSTFKTNKADKDKINFIIEYINIKYMFLRYYFYIQSGLEIYTNNNKVYFLNFKTNKDLLSFTKDVIMHSNEKFAFKEIKAEDYKGKKLLGYELYKPNIKLKDISKEFFINNKMIQWQLREISTLEYLMWLNIYSGRSFNDLTQYPIFPWLLTNYDKNEIEPKTDYRDLGLPMGMLTINEKGETRKEAFNDTYEMIKNDLKENFPDFNYSDFLKKQDDYYELYRNKKNKKKEKEKNENILDVNNLPYFYGNHYSNPTYVSHYLSRLFPSAFVAIEIQGEKFDDPDRMFFSLNKTFISASSLKDDVRELIPEFYLTPEIFINHNNLNLSQDKISSDNKKYEINNVELPPWSKNNPFNFVYKIRRILESSNIKALNKWIDLIFGNAQRGEKAEENKNIFKAQSYEYMIKINDITDPDSRNALMRLNEVGVTPLQIFSVDSKQKLDKKQFLEKSPIYINAKGNFIFEEKDLLSKIIKINNFKNIKTKLYNNEKCSKNKIYTLQKDDFSNIRITKMKQTENNNIRILTNTNQWFNIKINPNNKDLSPEESSLYDIENNSSKYANTFLMNNIQYPLIIYDNWKYLLKGGFIDGRIEFNNIIGEQKEETISQTILSDYGCINIMEMNEKENYLLCGTIHGNLLYFQINKNKIELNNNISIHSDVILSISINDNLNMFATSSKDGYIMLYTYPTFNLIRSIYIPSLFKEEKEFLWADNIFLSNYPLPCFTIYITKKKLFKIYTINGNFIKEIKEDENINNIKCGYIFTSFEFQDYLIYGTNNGFIVLRKFPELNLIQKINPFNNEKSIECLCLSKDLRFIFCWSESNEIAIISNNFSK